MPTQLLASSLAAVMLAGDDGVTSSVGSTIKGAPALSGSRLKRTDFFRACSNRSCEEGVSAGD